MAQSIDFINGVLDEIFLEGVDIHLERMSDGSVWMGIERDDSETSLVLNFGAGYGDLSVSVHWEGEDDDEKPWPGVRTYGTPPNAETPT
jgi:hypothetical protein